MSGFAPNRFSELCEVTRVACDSLTPMVIQFYQLVSGLALTAGDSETGKKLKDDASVFTTADGIVQHLLAKHLFGNCGFRAIVAEEDGEGEGLGGSDGDRDGGNILAQPYTVDELVVPLECWNSSMQHGSRSKSCRGEYRSERLAMSRYREGNFRSNPNHNNNLTVTLTPNSSHKLSLTLSKSRSLHNPNS